ncbi:hypothetical protein KGQ31_01735 [Patescibacteria group bacterium]|nr:hypothetical protein [Patescibacteria group bacterium]
MEQIKFFWSLAYRVWPPVIRTAVYLGFHDFRQKFLLGHLNTNYNKEDLARLLTKNGYERALISWKDPGEILSMRKVHNRIYQYHIRLFIDGEIRAHYEYTPESHPIDHVMEAHFVPETEYFRDILAGYLIVPSEVNYKK